MIRDIPAEQTSSTKQHHAASTAVRLLHGGGEGGEEEVLSCPSCNRDYELPRRCMRRHGDYDFNPIPRLLPCLHSLCHSCLEAQYENEGKNEIECVLCHHQEVIASVNVLPLHITILKQIVTNNSTQLMAVCARCYDDVTSTSWCETCSSALCDFHHQDHKLSVDTSKHNIATFKEYLHQGKHITYQFPPISCPQCPMQDCSLYCQHCLHVLSPKAFIDFHKTHPVCDIEDVTNEMQQAVDDSIVQSKTYSEKVHGKIKEIKRVLRTLDEQEEESMLVLTKTFNSIHAKLKKREKELLEKMTHSMSIQRKLLLDQLSSYMELYEDCNHVVQVAEAVRRDTQDTMTELMYLVAATDSIEYRSDSLAEQVDQQIKSTVLIDPRCRVDFMVEDLHILQGTINRLGGVYIAEEEKHMPWPKVQSEHSTSTTPRHHDEIEEEVMDNVYFTVEVSDVTASKEEAGMRKQYSNNFLPAANPEHMIIIEARLRNHTENADISISSTTSSPTRATDRDLKIYPDSPMKHAVEQDIRRKGDTLIGKVIIYDKIESKLMEKFRVKSAFETIRESKGSHVLSTLRIAKDIEAIPHH